MVQPSAGRDGLLHRLDPRRQDDHASAAQSLEEISMEARGKNGQIVFPDADLKAAADRRCSAVSSTAGECCNAGSRLISCMRNDRMIPRRSQGQNRQGEVGRVRSPTDQTKVGAGMISGDHLIKSRVTSRQRQKTGSNVYSGGGQLASTPANTSIRRLLAALPRTWLLRVRKCSGPSSRC